MPFPGPPNVARWLLVGTASSLDVSSVEDRLRLSPLQFLHHLRLETPAQPLSPPPPPGFAPHFLLASLFSADEAVEGVVEVVEVAEVL